MPELKAKVEVETKRDWSFGSVEVTMPQHECDICLVMPNGDQITLQYRLESPSLDVIIPGEPVAVTNWEGDDMKPAKSFGRGNSHVRLANQLVIPFNPEWVEVAEPPVAEKLDDSVRVLPSYNPDEAKKINELIERKGHLEYLCYMMLRALDQRCCLQGLLQRDETALKEFFGTDPEDEDTGCISAEGHTVPSLLQEWNKTTDEMMRAIARR